LGNASRVLQGYAYTEYDCSGEAAEKHKLSGGCFNGEVYKCV
jgi:hypothetical protein